MAAVGVAVTAVDSNFRWWLWTAAKDDNGGSGQRQSLRAEARSAASGQWLEGDRAQMVSSVYCAINGNFGCCCRRVTTCSYVVVVSWQKWQMDVLQQKYDKH